MVGCPFWTTRVCMARSPDWGGDQARSRRNHRTGRLPASLGTATGTRLLPVHDRRAGRAQVGEHGQDAAGFVLPRRGPPPVGHPRGGRLRAPPPPSPPPPPPPLLA